MLVQKNMLNYQGCKVLHIPILQKSTAHNGNYSHLTLQFSIITSIFKPYDLFQTLQSFKYTTVYLKLCIITGEIIVHHLPNTFINAVWSGDLQIVEVQQKLGTKQSYLVHRMTILYRQYSDRH